MRLHLQLRSQLHELAFHFFNLHQPAQPRPFHVFADMTATPVEGSRVMRVCHPTGKAVRLVDGEKFANLPLFRSPAHRIGYAAGLTYVASASSHWCSARSLRRHCSLLLSRLFIIYVDDVEKY
ncbi:hypothetical protein TKK_0006080 [Trichogramma kaykai]